MIKESIVVVTKNKKDLIRDKIYRYEKKIDQTIRKRNKYLGILRWMDEQ